MARRTKEEALETRFSLLDAAELLFQRQGVSRTSLKDIASEAGTSRGAIYWHFKDKADLFNAMMERVTLPLEQVFENLDQNAQEDTLTHLRQVMEGTLLLITNDKRTRRVLEVATHKVEYVDELQSVRLRHLAVRNIFLGEMEKGLKQAAAEQSLIMPLTNAEAAQGLHALTDGLIQNWLLDPQVFELAEKGTRLIDVYLAGLGFSLKPLSRPA
ncbi:HTH-type transcriptional regulator AcrR [Polaromonas vacuolata]|uniref:HTH-type transcriptional regulator AcrR n=1 Tax=Polaromonas vacuolata TaxID=37448 RepID=A0A6H2HC11_9BURK|nr:TetR family transcriptional regulator [Polaromonas vacuolata]QJC57134.1 HTH-type transcriptional regulator AcrR [Polaromonas vacuolata]